MSTPGITSPAFLFYNAGTKIQETLPFDYPGRDIREQGLTAYWTLAVEAESFFEVPSMIAPEGRPVWTGWDVEIMRRHGGKRVVQLVPTYVDNGDDLPYAANREDAVHKGRTMWKSYLIGIVQAHKDNISELRIKGVTPSPAQGLAKYALRTLGIEDPALDVQTAVTKTENTSEVDALKAQLTALQNVVNSLSTQPKETARKGA